MLLGYRHRLRYLFWFLSYAIAAEPAARAQEQAAGRQLRIVIEKGLGDQNVVGGGFASVKVRVTDAGGRPVPKAIVTFSALLPGTASPIVFRDGDIRDDGATADTETDEMGETPLLRMCSARVETQEFPISVTAAIGNESATSTIAQKNLAAQFGKLSVGRVGATIMPNDIKHHKASEPVVQVKNEKDEFIACAKVTFTVPKAGPSGTFAGGGLSFVTYTDADGKAVGSGFRPNDKTGKFRITVTGSVGDIPPAGVDIPQQNAGSSGLLWAGLGVAAAAGGVCAKVCVSTKPPVPMVIQPTAVVIALPGGGGSTITGPH